MPDIRCGRLALCDGSAGQKLPEPGDRRIDEGHRVGWRYPKPKWARNTQVPSTTFSTVDDASDRPHFERCRHLDTGDLTTGHVEQGTLRSGQARNRSDHSCHSVHTSPAPAHRPDADAIPVPHHPNRDPGLVTLRHVRTDSAGQHPAFVDLSAVCNQRHPAPPRAVVRTAPRHQ